MLLGGAWKHPVGGPRISLAGGRAVVAEDTQQEIKLKQRGAETSFIETMIISP